MTTGRINQVTIQSHIYSVPQNWDQTIVVPFQQWTNPRVGWVECLV